jgi:hypothetical protein
MELPVLVPVEYRGELVALASRERFHIVSPRLAARPAGDPELRFVAPMCACWGSALEHDWSSRITSTLVEEITRRALITGEALTGVSRLTDQQAAEALNVPVEQLELARHADLGAAMPRTTAE